MSPRGLISVNRKWRLINCEGSRRRIAEPATLKAIKLLKVRLGAAVVQVWCLGPGGKKAFGCQGFVLESVLLLQEKPSQRPGRALLASVRC